MLCEICICEEGPRERRGTGGNEGECLGIQGFSFSNHPSCSRRLFLVIEHHEYRSRTSWSFDMDCFSSSGACLLPIQFVSNLESRRTRLPATLRDLTCLTLTRLGQSLGVRLLTAGLTLPCSFEACQLGLLDSNICCRAMFLFINYDTIQLGSTVLMEASFMVILLPKAESI
jgi:hypothetical protein